MANSLLKAGTCSMEIISRGRQARLPNALRSVLAITLITLLSVTFAAAAKGKTNSNHSKPLKPETMPISASYPASRALYDEAMVDLENLRTDEAVKNLREATL